MQSDVIDTPTSRQLRRTIQAHRKARLKWSDHLFYTVTEGLGYGRSLRELPEQRLAELAQIITTYRPPRDEAFEYDAQGRYMYRLQRDAGWTDTELRHFLAVQFKKTHWNLLSAEEKRSVINTLKAILEEPHGNPS